MMRYLCLTWLSTVVVLACVNPARAADLPAARKLFADPPRQYSSAPLWVWNDMLTEEEVLGTLRDLAKQKVKQVFVHPRPGLMTPYLGPEWFRLWKATLQQAERLDMDVWIYDENSYPSGFAGGFVPEAMPESRGRGLHFAEVKQPGKPGKEVVGVYDIEKGSVNVTAKARAGEAMPEGRYLVASIQRAGNSPWHGNRCYVDLLYPGVTQKFLEITLDAYRRELGDQFGKRVPGSFTDEPNIRPAGGLPWTDDLPEQFQKRWHYDLGEQLPCLVRPLGDDWKRVRHDYYRTLLELFIERWAKPYHDYCERNKLEFTGHYWDHEWPDCVGVPDNMAMYAWHQRPAIDCLMNNYQENTHAQFGNLRMPKELSSVANQLGRKRTLCEAYGAGGWDLRFEDMKRIGDWLYVFGVNTLDQHLSYVTIRGARKWDHPQSFSYHEPWWDSYHVMAQYFTRLSAAMSQGEQINRVLVIEPTTTAWLYQADGAQAGKLKELGDRFFSLLLSLERAQVEYDLGCENIIAREGMTQLGIDNMRPMTALRVGRRPYECVVLPPGTENLDEATMRLLEDYAEHDGRVLCCGEPPALVDGRPSDRGAKAAKHRGWQRIDAAALPKQLAEAQKDFRIERRTDDKGILFHHRRRLDQGELVLLVNTSIDAPCTGQILTPRWGAERWDPATGKIAPYPFKVEKQFSRFDFSLPPCGSLLLYLSEPQKVAGKEMRETATPVAASGAMTLRRVAPNVLTLDYFDVTAGGETKKGLHCYQACQFAFQKNGMERNPWDSAVQFKDELITKKFPPESGCEATYHFAIEGAVPKPLEIVIERPDLYTITCNGKPVAAEKGAWWLDKSFGRIDIAAAARVGENAVTIKAAPMTIYHELMPAYVLGDFSLKPAAAGFVIAPAAPLKLGKWNEQGMPLYAAGVAYSQQFEASKPAGRYRVRLPAWYGSVAKVSVNGKPAGHVACAPWECDVTDQVAAGTNTIEVVVVGTLKNTLGPHHAGAMRGQAWPSAFHQGPATGPPPGEKYDTIGYGLLEPFVLEQVR